MSENAINQRYVQKSYLFPFRSNPDRKTVEDAKIHCLDKQSGKLFEPNIKNVASGRRMYDTEYCDGSRGTLEHDLSVWEDEWRESRDLLVARGWEGLTVEHRHRLAKFVAVQLLRTAEIRQRLETILEITQEVAPATSPDRRILPQAHEALLRNAQQEEAILMGMNWVVGESASRTPLWLSDVPVTRWSVPDRTGRSHVALNGPGTVLYLPLTPTIGLKLAAAGSNQAHSHRERLSAADVDFRNRLQVAWSRRFLFSPEADFQRAQEQLQQDPALCDPDRPTLGLEEYVRRSSRT